MKNVLITGANSYIGINVEKYLMQWTEDYKVETLDMQNESWQKFDFSGFDTVFHVAAIVHQKERAKNKDLYYMVNRDMAYEVAKKSNSAKVKQFIFISTMAIYGENGSINQELSIDKNTPPNPKTHYGISKFQAENLIMQLHCDSFKVCIIRPPMIYGPNCKGNYEKLEQFIKKIPVVPYIENQRSMLHVEKLAEDIMFYIDNNSSGIFLPQDNKYMSTMQLIDDMAKKNNINIYYSKILGRLIVIFGKNIGTLQKIFGNLVYSYDQ